MVLTASHRIFITGVAGFIGSHLADRLLGQGYWVVGYDNFSTGYVENLDWAAKQPGFTLIHGDVLDLDALVAAISGCGFVFHLSANADVRFGPEHPRNDLDQNTIGTFNVLEAMRANGVHQIAFASTASIYGEPDVFPTPEKAPFPIQTSFYGASKLAGEALIGAYCEGFDFQAWIFRFVSILGERYSHGHVFDFYKRLLANPNELHILGDGHQKKSYLYIHDCIDAMLLATEKAREKVNIFNLGTNEYCEVNDSVAWIAEHLGLNPMLKYSGGKRGWIGDSPFIFLDCTKINSLDWHPKLKIKDAVIMTLDFLRRNPWVLERR